MSYLENTIFGNFDTVDFDDITNIYSTKTGTLTISIYDIETMKTLNNFISILPSTWIGYTQIPNNTTLEKMAYDIYSNPNYWDVLLILNSRLPLFDMPYDYDVLNNLADSAVTDYEENVLKRSLPDDERENFRLQYLEKLNEENENKRIIKYIYPDYLQEFLQRLSNLGIVNT